ncbi:MAG: hypothetical protein ACXWPP_15960 [Ktedonobacteraceae bacterium]
MLNNVTFFEWIGFFFGGAVGSFIILGLGMLFDSVSSKRKYKEEKAQITYALLEELKINSAASDDMIDKINQIPNGAYTFPRLSYTWLEAYSNRFLDFRVAKDREIYKKLDIVRKKVQVIQGVLDAQQMLVATSRTMPNFKQAVIDYNDSIKIQAGELN